MDRLIALILLCWASAAQAQQWQANRIDGGHFIVHDARANAGVRLFCLAPSLQGRPAIEVEQHEESPTGRDTLRLEIRADRIPVGNAVSRGDVVLWLDQTGYRLPQLSWNELNNIWEVDLPYGDGLWGALGQAGSIILAPGQDQAWQLPAAALGTALEAVRAGCAADWAAADQRAPASVTIPQAMLAHVARGCSASAPIPPAAVQAGDLDRDGTPDFVLDWGGIRCPGPLARPFCGAANCSHDVFLSSRGYGTPVTLLGTSVAIVPHRSGGLALGRGGTFSLCGANNEFCAAPLVWDGASFSERP